MGQIRIRMELNKGRRGMPLGKLASVTKETQGFLSSLSSDVLRTKGSEQWLAERFDNGSVGFDCCFPQTLEEPEADRLRRGLRAVFANDYSDTATAVLIRPETRRRYASITRGIDTDEIVRFGLYRNGADGDMDWFDLTRDIAAAIEDPLEAKPRSFGEIQGIVHSFFKEDSPQRVKVRELSTAKLIDCTFEPGLYEQVLMILADPAGVVFVEGWVTESGESGLVESVEATSFRPAPEFDEQIYRDTLGSMPDFTGSLSTVEFIREVRGE